MPQEGFDLAHFFAWARSRAYRELEERLALDPELDPNWTFSDIMQGLLDEFRRSQSGPSTRRADGDGEDPAQVAPTS